MLVSDPNCLKNGTAIEVLILVLVDVGLGPGLLYDAMRMGRES